MSVNLVYAIDQKKVKKFGKNFGTIDFEVATCPSKISFMRLGREIHVGTLCIAGRKYRMTLEQLENLVIDLPHMDAIKIFGDTFELSKYEIERCIETLKTAKHVFFQKYRLGVS